MASSCGPVVGTTVSTAASPAVVEHGRQRRWPRRRWRRMSAASRSTASAAASSGGALGQVDGHQERPVGARPEALAHQVVGLAAGQLLGPVAGVGHAEAHVERRGGQRQQHDEGGEAGEQRAALHDPAPPPRQRAAALDVVAEPRQPEPVDRPAGEAEHRRQQRDRGEHDHRDRQRGRQGDAPQVVAAHQHQAEDRHHDRRRRRTRRPARRSPPASTTASRGSRPSASADRKRVTMNRA